jgi:beta-glucosidase
MSAYHEIDGVPASADPWLLTEVRRDDLGTSGEGCDVADLRLAGVQADLLAELPDTGTPVVVGSGRLYALGDVHGRAAALVAAFLPGREGAP